MDMLKPARSALPIPDSHSTDSRLPQVDDPAAKGSLLFATSNHRFALDCTDLIDHFQTNRFPTGIQRVQINLAVCALGDETRGDRCAVVFFAPEPAT
jgi:hypothetical protein